MTRKKDLYGKKFGKLLAIKELGSFCLGNGQTPTANWECLCDCGKSKIASTSMLTQGIVRSCGCIRPKKDLIGKTFGKLTVIRKFGVTVKGYRQKWLCQCECGKERVVITNSLKSGKLTDCGRECSLKPKIYKVFYHTTNKEELSFCLKANNLEDAQEKVRSIRKTAWIKSPEASRIKDLWFYPVISE